MAVLPLNGDSRGIFMLTRLPNAGEYADALLSTAIIFVKAD